MSSLLCQRFDFQILWILSKPVSTSYSPNFNSSCHLFFLNFSQIQKMFLTFDPSGNLLVPRFQKNSIEHYTLHKGSQTQFTWGRWGPLGAVWGRVWVRMGHVRFSARKALIKASQCCQISSFSFYGVGQKSSSCWPQLLCGPRV